MILFQTRSGDSPHQRGDHRGGHLQHRPGEAETGARSDRGRRRVRRERRQVEDDGEEGRLPASEARPRRRDVRKAVGRRRKSLHRIVEQIFVGLLLEPASRVTAFVSPLSVICRKLVSSAAAAAT